MLNRNIVNIIVKYYDYNSFLFDFDTLEKYLDKVNWSHLSGNTNIPYTFFEEGSKVKEYLQVKWYPFLRKN